MLNEIFSLDKYDVSVQMRDKTIDWKTPDQAHKISCEKLYTGPEQLATTTYNYGWPYVILSQKSLWRESGYYGNISTYSNVE